MIAADSVRCGTRDALPGFAVLEASGDHVGFDADFCKAVAAAVLGDATKVEFVDLETADRFTALQAGSSRCADSQHDLDCQPRRC